MITSVAYKVREGFAMIPQGLKLESEVSRELTLMPHDQVGLQTSKTGNKLLIILWCIPKCFVSCLNIQFLYSVILNCWDGTQKWISVPFSVGLWSLLKLHQLGTWCKLSANATIQYQISKETFWWFLLRLDVEPVSAEYIRNICWVILFCDASYKAVATSYRFNSFNVTLGSYYKG